MSVDTKWSANDIPTNSCSIKDIRLCNLCLPTELLVEHMDINLCPPDKLVVRQMDINLCFPDKLVVDQTDKFMSSC